MRAIREIARELCAECDGALQRDPEYNERFSNCDSAFEPLQ